LFYFSIFSLSNAMPICWSFVLQMFYKNYFTMPMLHSSVKHPVKPYKTANIRNHSGNIARNLHNSNKNNTLISSKNP